MGIVKTNRVDFVAFQMTGSAKKWWRDYLLNRQAGSPALTWDQFSQLFIEKFLPITLREDRRRTVSVCSRDASVLFDPRSTYSCVSSYFASYLVVPRDYLSAPVYASTPVRDAIIVDRVYRSCVVTTGSLKTRVDLLLLNMVDFDVILGMYWLSPYHAILDCHLSRPF
ncbi:uncharacterized protein [Nicotiana tomentosiformis]|uniref:uncharacterized protein n=1 Tax=Nicotiana tomentosiformis TaxID=4098 RepID=UPI00388C8092